jgi:hypothetical protein
MADSTDVEKANFLVEGLRVASEREVAQFGKIAIFLGREFAQPVRERRLDAIPFRDLQIEVA